jgi:uncharacterized protein YceK
MLIKILVTFVVTFALTGCSQLSNKSDAVKYPEVTASTLLTQGCTGFFATGSETNRSENIAKFRQLADMDSNYFELLRTAIELDLILGTKSLDEVKNLKPEYKSRVFTAVTTLTTYCG